MTNNLEKDIKIINKALGINGTNGMNTVYSKLYQLYKKRGIAKFHIILQYIMSAYLYNKGYDVYVEEELGKGYRADVYAEAPWESLIVEVETGYIPPSRHVDFEDYLIGKITYKTLIYSQYADKFGLAIPSHIDIRIPEYLICNNSLNLKTNIMKIIYNIYKYNNNLIYDILNKIYKLKIDKIYKIYIKNNKIYINEINIKCQHSRNHNLNSIEQVYEATRLNK